MQIFFKKFLKKINRKKNASTGNRTRATCLEGRYSSHWTIDARHRQDLNLRGQSPPDFKSGALTTRPRWLRMLACKQQSKSYIFWKNFLKFFFKKNTFSFLFSVLHIVVQWPSGLRRSTQVRVSSEAWVRTPPEPFFFTKKNFFSTIKKVRHPGVEPGPPRWQRGIIAARLMAQSHRTESNHRPRDSCW